MEMRCEALRRGGALTLAAVLACAAVAAPAAEQQQAENELGHPNVDGAADLSREEAIDFYESIAERMQLGYALSRDPTAHRYRSWHLYNDAPYRSAAHGNRYVNIYANYAARRAGYGHMKPGDRMPPGAILASDSLTVTKIGARFPGALSIMEKLRPGISPDTGDWRYAMILPDGSFLGDTTADTGDKVMFCHACHAQRADTDDLFFVPQDLKYTQR